MLKYIIFVCNTYSDWGTPNQGFPLYVYKTCVSLKKMGLCPMILTVGRYNHYREDDGIPIWTVRVESQKLFSKELNFALTGMMKSYILNKKLKQIMMEYPIDIVQFTSLEGVGIFYNSSATSILRLSSYAKTYFSTYSTYSEPLVDRMALIERLSSFSCDAIFAPCSNTALAFGKDINRHVSVIETPFINDVKIYDFQYVNNELKNKKYALFFGTLYEEKGVYVIAKILKKFLKNNMDYYFVFVGDVAMIRGENARELLYKMAGEVKERVITLPSLPHAKLYPIIMNADFVTLPSLMDNFPNACIEAMHFGKIVIGTNGASFEQLIDDGENGFLVNINDTDSLYNKMEYVVNMSEEERERISTNATARIDKLSPDYVVTSLLDFYDYTKNYRSIFVWRKYFRKIIVRLLELCFCLYLKYYKIFYQHDVLQKDFDKNIYTSVVMEKWLEIHQNKKCIAQYFLERKFSRIAVYGMGYMGKMAVQEMQANGLNIIYAIDMRSEYVSCNLKVLNWNDEWPLVDIILITVMDPCKFIENKIKDKSNIRCVAIVDVLHEI